MTTNTTLVDNDSLNVIAEDIKKRSKTILSTFNGECTNAIKSTDSALQIAGLSSESVLGAFKRIFEGFDERIVSLSDFVIKTVNEEYAYTSKCIVESFDNSIGNSLNNLLNETNITAASASNQVSNK